jgi:hypothetical protein
MQKITKQQAAKFKKQILNDKGNDEDELIDFFMDYWMENGEMPYGTQKARDGDPGNWTADQMEKVGKDELFDIIDGLTESTSSIKAHFDKKIISENNVLRSTILRKKLSKMVDDVEDLADSTKPGKWLDKSVREAGGDEKLLSTINDEFEKMYNNLNDLLMSCFVNEE